MKKKFTLITAFLFIMLIVNAQSPTFAWAKKAGNSGSDIAISSTIDPSGNVYVTGYFEGTVDFDPGVGVFNLTSAGFSDIYILKLSASGNFLWAAAMGNPVIDIGWGIALDGSGNVYCTGQFQGTVDFDPGAGVFNLTAAVSYDSYILKLDANGNFIFAKQIGGSSAESGYSIFIDASGNIYSTGSFAGTADFDPGAGIYNLTSVGTDIFVQKLDASGNFLWAKSFGGTSSGSRGKSIVVDGSGNTYVTGYFQGTVDFDPSAGVFNLTSAGVYDVFIEKLDVSGNFLWAKKMGSVNTEEGWDITIDVSGNIYTVGYFESTVDFDPGAGTFNLTSAGLSDVFIQKLDVNGNFLWAKKMGAAGADNCLSIITDGTGNVYTTGFFYNTVDFDPGAGIFNLTSLGGRDIFIQKLDPTGNFLWSVSMGGATDDGGYSISVSTTGNIYTAGYFESTVDFDPGAGVANLIATGAGVSDIFVQKLYACASPPSQPGSISGTNSLCSGVGATNYSIALVGGATSYTWNLPGGWSGSSSTNTISATPGTTGIFTVTAINDCGISPQQTLNVTVNALPTISANTTNTLLCVGQSATLTASGASTYTWNPGGAGTNITVSPTVTANYTITGTDANGCVNSSTFTQNVSACTGIKTFEEALGLIVYPNPTNGKITITYKINWLGFEIYNSLGQKLQLNKVVSKESVEVDLSGLPEGIYFVKVGSVTRKLIKQ